MTIKEIITIIILEIITVLVAIVASPFFLTWILINLVAEYHWHLARKNHISRAIMAIRKSTDFATGLLTKVEENIKEDSSYRGPNYDDKGEIRVTTRNGVISSIQETPRETGARRWTADITFPTTMGPKTITILIFDHSSYGPVGIEALEWWMHANLYGLPENEARKKLMVHLIDLDEGDQVELTTVIPVIFRDRRFPLKYHCEIPIRELPREFWSASTIASYYPPNTFNDVIQKLPT